MHRSKGKSNVHGETISGILEDATSDGGIIQWIDTLLPVHCHTNAATLDRSIGMVVSAMCRILDTVARLVRPKAFM